MAISNKKDDMGYAAFRKRGGRIWCNRKRGGGRFWLTGDLTITYVHHTAGADTGFSKRTVYRSDPQYEKRICIRPQGGGGGRGGPYTSGPVSTPVQYICTQW